MPHRLVVLRQALACGLVLFLMGTVARTAQAQDIQIETSKTPLASVLQTLRAQAGLDLVYAERLIDGK